MEILNHENLYQRVIEEIVLEAKQRVWIVTANLKDMYIKAWRGYKPILDEFNRMANQGVSFRVVHADKMSTSFTKTLSEYPVLQKNLEIQICPRSHWKMIIVEGKAAYFGSANFTGAGLGVKNENIRNLEIGALCTSKDKTDKEQIAQLEVLFDNFWMGEHCIHCERRKYCASPIA
ncbi:MAG: phospholipase D family protein [Gammaproteobacteria bacterium]|nr:phospholipase D family protein [Gammaproteobacteria bacterium]